MKKFIAIIMSACLVCGVLVSCAANRNIVKQDDKTTGETVMPPATGTSASGVSDDDVTQMAQSGGDADAQASVSEESEETEKAQSKYSLEDFDGWWYHIGGEIGGDAVVDVFMVDAESGTWTEYSRYGAPGGTYTCYADEDGISLDYGDVGVTFLRYDGVALLNAMGYIEYAPGDPIEVLDVSMYEGKWYEFGNTEGEYYEISADSYTLQSGGETVESGTWVSEDIVRTIEDGSTVNELQLSLSSGNVSTVYIVADKGAVLYDIDNSTAYIREDVLGTAEGDNLVRRYDLICHLWAGADADMPDVEFGYYGNKFYLISTFTNENGETETIREACGTWSITEFELSLHYADGHEEITPYDPETLIFSYYNHMSFTKNEN